MNEIKKIDLIVSIKLMQTHEYNLYFYRL